MDYWSNDEIEKLEKFYESKSIEEMIILLPNRTKDAIQWKASNLGILKRDGKKLEAFKKVTINITQKQYDYCLLYTSPSPRDGATSRMPSSA